MEQFMSIHAREIFGSKELITIILSVISFFALAIGMYVKRRLNIVHKQDIDWQEYVTKIEEPRDPEKKN